MSSSSSISPEPTIWSVCKAGFKRNRVPALILQSFAALLLLVYFKVPSLRGGFESIGEFKRNAGVWYPMVSTAFFAGFIPWLVLLSRGRIDSGKKCKDLAFYLGFWALQGFMVNTLYTLQNAWFGSEPTFRVLLIKMLVDQGPYNFIWATPNCILFFGWKNADYNWRRFFEQITWKDTLRKYATIQVSMWIVWIPAVTMIYALPPDLQIPLFNLVICFYSLVLIFVSRD